MLFSTFAFRILFGSIEIFTLQYRLYPPFGLITEAFMPLGAYLLLVGIYTAATNVARDAKLRKEFYKSAMSQFNLLKTIGVTQMEKELLKEYKIGCTGTPRVCYIQLECQSHRIVNLGDLEMWIGDVRTV